jgi:predicted alpha/beta hydrolase family esterase
MSNKGKTGIVFMHGAGMGKWIWKYIEPLLKNPYIMPARWDTASNIPVVKIKAEDCIKHIIKQVNNAGFEKIVLVAHSGSGVIAPQVASGLQGRVKHILYVAANVPFQGKNALDMLPLLPRIMNAIMIALMAKGFKMPKKNMEKVIRETFCNDCNEETIQYMLANELVAEPPALAFFRANYKGIPETSCTYIRTMKDKTLSPAAQEKMAKAAGCMIVDIDSGHMPMLSMPDEFADMINRVAR